MPAQVDDGTGARRGPWHAARSADQAGREPGRLRGRAPGHADLQQARAGRADPAEQRVQPRAGQGERGSPRPQGHRQATVNVRAIGAVGRRVGGHGRRRYLLVEGEDGRCRLPARRILGRLEQPGHPDAGDQYVRDARTRVSQADPPGAGDRDAQPAGTAGDYLQRLNRAGRRDPGGDAAGRGGHPELAGDLPGRAVVEQAYPDAGRRVKPASEADLDPLLHR